MSNVSKKEKEWVNVSMKKKKKKIMKKTRERERKDSGKILGNYYYYL